MDDKPHRFPPPPFPKRATSDQHDDNQANSDNAEERPKKRRVVDASTTCAPEQLHCRYANKKCLNPRAVKRTGGLHTFCAMHRANANRNQRRLDMRKRMARQALRAQSEGGQPPPTANATTPRLAAAMKTEALTPTPSPTEEYAQYEPLQTPTPLQQEDISTLVTLFLPPVVPHLGAESTFGYHLGLPVTPRTHTDWPSSANVIYFKNNVLDVDSECSEQVDTNEEPTTQCLVFVVASAAWMFELKKSERGGSNSSTTGEISDEEVALQQVAAQ
ncbi:unnamed protein product [Phytophthora lilii]|uniref:Unnamed protein product n=1 Tax=Phytophthora lilii TaxID=2077276 RepID=A0A9W6TP83_9STRA|nr:unnamed protein product [Phytophthora lilii]